MEHRRRERGQTAVWVVMIIALLVVGFLATMIARPQGGSALEYLLAFLCIAIIAVGGVREARRDVYSFCAPAIVLALIPAIIAVAMVVSSSDFHPLAILVALSTIALIVTCFGYLLRATFARDPLRNLLLEQFSRARIFDANGVQFVAVGPMSMLTLDAGTTFTVEVLAQNGWDAERSFVFALDSRASNALILDTNATIVLPPGAAGTLKIPVRLAANSHGYHELVARPRVIGEAGKLLRRWRAQPLPEPVSRGWQLAALIGGILVWGGGMKFGVKIRRRALPVENSLAPAPPAAQIVWAPSAQRG